MNINIWLCKHFDSNKKGYVTVSDFVEINLSYSIILFFVLSIFFIGGTTFGRMQQMEFNNTFSLSAMIIYLIKAWEFPIIIIVSIIVLGLIWYKISDIKIAKCELKDKEIKHE